MKLLEPVLTFELLDGENLSDDDRKLALALGSDIENMEFTLKRFLKKIKNL